MASESRDPKLLGNFRKFIDLVSADPNYKPSKANVRAPGPGAGPARSIAVDNSVMNSALLVKEYVKGFRQS